MGIFRQLNPFNWIPKSSSFWARETLDESWNTTLGQETAYRLKKWPDIHDEMKHAGSYRALSLLSMGPVCIKRLTKCMNGNLTHTIEFLQHLDHQAALEIVEMEWKVSQLTLQQTLKSAWKKSTRY